MAEEQGKTGEINSLEDVWSSDAFVRGLERFDSIGKEEPAKVEATPTPTEEPCSDCGKDKEDPAPKETRTPIKTIKVQGKDFHFYDQKEIDEYASKGVDYTKKRQQDADDRRNWFAQKEKEWDELKERVSRMGPDLEKRQPEVAAQPQAPAAPKSIYEELGVDPEYLEPWERKRMEKMAQQDQMLTSYKAQVEKLSQATRLMFFDKSLDIAKQTIKQTSEEYPIEPVIDESGKDLTGDIFINILENKMRETPEEDMPKLIQQSVKDLHKLQSLVKGQGRAEAKDLVTPDDISPEDFQAKHPTLAQKIADAAVADYLAKRGEVPPTLERKGGAVDPSRIQSRKDDSEPSSLEDAFEKGWEAEGKAAFTDFAKHHHS